MWCWQSGIACAAAASAVVVASVFFPAEPALAESFRINNVDKAKRINMREQPSNRSKVVAYIPPDSTLEGTGNCDERWCEVRFRDRVGWVFRKYLVPGEGKAAEAAVPPKPVQVPAPEPSAAAQAEPEQDDIPADLQDTMLRLVFAGGRPIPVYAFPSDRLPAAGRLDPSTRTVEDLGTCSRKFCYIRSGSLVGWIPEEAIVRDKSGAARTEPPAKSEPRAQTDAPAQSEPAPVEAAANDEADPPRALDGTVPTATQPGQTTGLPIDNPGSVEIKTYSVAGLSSDASLPAREQPEDGAPIAGWIPGNATDIEGLRKCVQKYCLVRHEAVTGWVARRHLADESAASKRYLVSGVALWGALDVVDYPGQGAAIVGHIPAYASGIVPIGNCDRDWCHIRYLGIAGWVSGKYLAQQSR
jgi:SH3-like domain-containing protein